MSVLNIVCWNVNGFRTVVKKGMYNFLHNLSPDIFCMQEIRYNYAPLIDGYTVIWNPAKKPGYAGTATLVKQTLAKKMLGYALGIGISEFDSEGRVITVEFPLFYLVNVYFPHSRHDLSRLDFKMRFNRKVLDYANKLRKQKDVIICGDFNVAHKEIDIARPKDNVGNPGFTDEERAFFDAVLKEGYIDIFRKLHPSQVKYSWWSYRFGARKRNIGWRIDYFVSTERILKCVNKCDILTDVMGSDHAPILLSLNKECAEGEI